MVEKALRLTQVSNRLEFEIKEEEEKYTKLKYAIENITPDSDISTPSLALMKEQLIIMEKFVKILKQRHLQLEEEIQKLKESDS